MKLNFYSKEQRHFDIHHSWYVLPLIFVFEKERRKTKKRMREEEIEKGDCGTPTPKYLPTFVSFDEWLGWWSCFCSGYNIFYHINWSSREFWNVVYRLSHAQFCQIDNISPIFEFETPTHSLLLSSRHAFSAVVNCNDPGALENGARSGSVFTFGGEVTYTCNPGYTLSGSSIRRCQANGLWSGTPASCTSKCCLCFLRILAKKNAITSFRCWLGTASPGADCAPALT